MPQSLRWTLLAVDLGMLAYWLFTALAAAKIVAPPPEWMYDGYGTPMIDAWNWSFAPLDILFSLAGLAAVRLARHGDRRWVGWATVSLALTGCAGLMAISFWALTGDANPGWWAANGALMGVALYWLPKLVAAQS